MNGILYIAAKAPRPGLAKTRLGAQIGHRQAIRLYRAFLEDIAGRFSDAPFPVGWYITPANGWHEISAGIGHLQRSDQVLCQPDGDWTQRQREFFRDQTPSYDHPVILIASDSPQITLQMVREGFRLLQSHDLVLGPVTDGGYWLIGMRTWLDVFDGISMSTATVVNQIAERATGLGASLGYAASTFDIDTRADLQPLIDIARKRDDLSATRCALESLGLLPDGFPAPNGTSSGREPQLASRTNNWSIRDGR